MLTDEGKRYATVGSPEVQLMLAIPPEGISKDELQVKLAYPFLCFVRFQLDLGLDLILVLILFFWLQKKLDPSLFKIACAQAAKNKWVEMGKQLITRKVCN